MSFTSTAARQAAAASNLPKYLARAALPMDTLERVWAWGMAASAMSYVFRPSRAEDIASMFDRARKLGVRVGLRGAGRSYGDASLASEQICLDLTRMNRILDWNPDTGQVSVEPGVTIRQLWQYAIGDGWWPSVVPGTMFPTIGGCAGMNIHGKNNYRAGTIGDHIVDFDLMLPTGEVRRCSRERNSELFHAAIGGFGMLGCFLRLTLQMKRVHSGWLRVEPIAIHHLRHLFEVFEENVPEADYLVGWIDCFGAGARLGRGLVHRADYLEPGEDSNKAQSLRVENQELPDSFFGVVPKSIMWRLMRPTLNNAGVRAVNAAKFRAGLLKDRHTHLESHAGFAFLLDYVPDWKKAYGSGGLIQYQSFIPRAAAPEVFREQLSLCQRRGLVPYLGVFKQHRPDPFLMTHAVDGFSLALDFKVTAANRARLWALAAELDQITLDSGGRFYFAKDLTLRRDRIGGYLAEERVQRFLRLKRECDPEELLVTDLYRRLFLP